MYSERRSTHSELRGAVVWRHTRSAGETPGSGLVLPDGCTDLIFDGDALSIAGPDTMAFATAGRPCVGIRLPSGVGPPVWGLPGSEIVDQHPPLDAIWPVAVVRTFTEQVAAAADPGAELERIVVDRWRAATPDEAMLSTAAALRTGESVASAAARCGYSERQLHRRSLAAFGYGPKTLARILRLTSALDQARGGVRLATVAHLCGYADQAHLSREARAFTGQTLTALLAPG